MYIRDDTRQVGRSPKLKSDPWKGPAIILEKKGDLLYRVQASAQGKQRILHHDRMKPYNCEDVPGWIQRLRRGMTKPTPVYANQETQTDPAVEEVAPVEEEPSSGDGEPPAEDQGLPEPRDVTDRDDQSSGPTLRRSPRKRKPPQRYGY